MASPEGYRKALRMMKQAEKFGRPVICFVDTPGAFCGIEAEERGQGEAIARNLFEMAGLKVPVLTIVTGEGGSGGALALASGDEVWMLENAVYSILSPEGFARLLSFHKIAAKPSGDKTEYTAFSSIHTSSPQARASAPPLPPSPIKMDTTGVFSLLISNRFSAIADP